MFGEYDYDLTHEEYLAKIAEVFKDEKTVIFLDTNILSYMYKLHDTARQDFFDWIDGLKGAGRLKIPAWVGKEYSEKSTSGKLDDYLLLKKTSDQAAKYIQGIVSSASLFVDERILKSLGHTESPFDFIASFKGLADEVEKYARVFKKQPDAGVIHKQIVSRFSECVLNSDISALAQKASAEGPSRYENRLGPGYKDAGKTENPYGDLIIWFEILMEVERLSGKEGRGSEFENVVLLTNDGKSDWVYKPTNRALDAAGGRKFVPNNNPVIKLARPDLERELKLSGDVTSFWICELSMLVEGMSRVEPKRFKNLASAIQVEVGDFGQVAEIESERQNDSISPQDEDDEPVEVVDVKVAEEQGIEEDAAEVAGIQNDGEVKYVTEALEDSRFTTFESPAVGKVVKDLKSQNWYVQNPAAKEVRKLLRDEEIKVSPNELFVLGRNVYQAACGNAFNVMELISGLESLVTSACDERGMDFLNGVVYEIYFDSAGAYRQSYKFDLADEPLRLLKEERFGSTKDFLLKQLRPFIHDLVYMPGSVESVRADIVLKATDNEGQWEVESAICNDVEMVVKETEQAWLNGSIFSRGRVYMFENLVSTDLGIPKWALQFEYSYDIAEDSRFYVRENYEMAPRYAFKKLSSEAVG